MHFDSLSLLKVESTVCFQRKRRRERAVTRELFAKFGTKSGNRQRYKCITSETTVTKLGQKTLQTSHLRRICNAKPAPAAATIMHTATTAQITATLGLLPTATELDALVAAVAIATANITLQFFFSKLHPKSKNKNLKSTICYPNQVLKHAYTLLLLFQ